MRMIKVSVCFFLQAEDGIRDIGVTGVQTCALPILPEREGVPRVQAAVAELVHGHERERVERLELPHAREVEQAVPSDRKSVVSGKSVDLGGRRIIKKTRTNR